jgi:hypothetical protein
VHQTELQDNSQHAQRIGPLDRIQGAEMDQNDEPKLWVSILKVILGIAVMVGAVGFALWYAGQQPAHSPALEQAKEEVRQKSSNSTSSPSNSWGISKDSPIRK